MIRALLIKEFWDVRGMVAMAALAYAILLANMMGMPFFEWVPHIPKSTLPFPGYAVGLLAFYGAFFAAAFGLLQGWTDHQGQRWLFVLPQPIRRSHLILAKLAIGLGIWLLMTLLALALSVLIAVAPSIIPAPFEWWMLQENSEFLLLAPTCYLGGFLSGLRPASWFGTRLFPLIGAIAMFYLDWIFVSLLNLVHSMSFAEAFLCHVLFYSLANLGIVLTILEIARKRDYP